MINLYKKGGNRERENMETRLKGKQNVYLGIVAEYKKLIGLGAIRYGEKLPSCRALAIELGVNPNTVERAYCELEAAGYIRILPKKGAYADYAAEDERRRVEELRKQLRVLRDAGVTFAELSLAMEEVYAERTEGREEENCREDREE